MENTSTSEQQENGTREENASATSGQKTSRKSAGKTITHAARLRILQQAAYDCGAKAKDFGDGTVGFLVAGCKMVDGHLVPEGGE